MLDRPIVRSPPPGTGLFIRRMLSLSLCLSETSMDGQAGLIVDSQLVLRLSLRIRV